MKKKRKKKHRRSRRVEARLPVIDGYISRRLVWRLDRARRRMHARARRPKAHTSTAVHSSMMSFTSLAPVLRWRATAIYKTPACAVHTERNNKMEMGRGVFV